MDQSKLVDDVRRAIAATQDEHADAIESVRCAMCGANPKEQCRFGPQKQTFIDWAHTRRVRTWFALQDRIPNLYNILHKEQSSP